jgi:hypothetical protein
MDSLRSSVQKRAKAAGFMAVVNCSLITTENVCRYEKKGNGGNIPKHPNVDTLSKTEHLNTAWPVNVNSFFRFISVTVANRCCCVTNELINNKSVIKINCYSNQNFFASILDNACKP